MNKIRLNILVCIGLMAAISGCAPLSFWQPSDRLRELPYANGKVVVSKYRTESCIMCPTGMKSEEAFFSGLSKYYLKDVGQQAEEILTPIQQREGWQKLGTDFQGNDKFFAPIRIFMISIDPIIIVTIPWKYKEGGNNPTQYDVSRAAEVFSETDLRQGSFSYIPQYWTKRLRMPVEVRGSLPQEAVQARVITTDHDTTLTIPVDDAKSVAADLGAYKLRLTRAADGKVLASFDRR